ncbi:hypothetical protein L1887_20533 [Cichorium endivia]|nr:hypothetical protein L1887_20533 [Cichorium endivia]
MATSTLQPLTTPSLHHTLQLSATKPHRHCTTIKSHSVSKCSLDSTTNLAPKPNNKRRLVGVGIGLLAASMLISSPLDANATRIEYYATVAEPSCNSSFAWEVWRFTVQGHVKSGKGRTIKVVNHMNGNG